MNGTQIVTSQLELRSTIDEDNHNHTYNVKLETKVNDKFILATQ